MKTDHFNKHTSNLNIQHVDVIVVGAGAAGIGMGAALSDFGIQNFLILEKYQIGASFTKWPKETRLLTPSFQSTQFGLLDLNAVALNTSPALSAGVEHLSGEEYAVYLQRVAKVLCLPVLTGIDVLEVQKVRGEYHLKTSTKLFTCTYLIWACGEFQYPYLNTFPGSEMCTHTSAIASYRQLAGDEYVIIGGYESGIDAAINLAKAGKQVTVFEKNNPISPDEQDPSVSLSFYTRQRILDTEEADSIEIVENCLVRQVIKLENGLYHTITEDGVFETIEPPILATGYQGGEYLIKELFEFNVQGEVQLTEWDESTKNRNLFLVGPHVKHDKVIFCFIYKFRQRFGIVATKIAADFKLDASEAIESYRENQMYLDDLSCCTADVN